MQKLFLSALNTVRSQNAVQAHHLPRRIAAVPWELSPSDDADSESNHFLSTEDRRGSPSNSLFHELDVQNSRYCNDFFEIGLLGKGGFASVWRVRNKLDGIEYAVKKVRLGNDLENGAGAKGDNPYEKIFREIKHLARLEHKNVIRYYASWLEYGMTTEKRILDASLDEEESTCGN